MTNREIDSILKQGAQAPHDVEPELLDRLAASLGPTIVPVRPLPPAWLLACAFAVIGIGTGLFQTPNNSAVMGSAPADRRGVAGATLATMRNLGMVFGEAASAAILAACMGSRGVDFTFQAGPASASWVWTRMTIAVAAYDQPASAPAPRGADMRLRST